MITYRIVYKSSESKHPTSGKSGKHAPRNQTTAASNPSKPDYKDHIFQRALARIASFLKDGDHIKVKGTPKRGKVVRIRTNINEINWVNNQPHFVEIEVDGVMSLAHPSQLKRLGNK
jgi:hypothetical protein